MDKEYVKEYGQLEATHWWFTARKKILQQLLRRSLQDSKGKSLKILNVGAAAGGSSEWLAEFGQVVSVENDPLFVDHLRSRQLPVVNASATALPFEDNSFDLVCALDVIEHIENDGKAVAELFRVCKKNGNVCLTVPAFQAQWGNHDKVNHHYRRYSKTRLQRVLPAGLYSDLYTSYFNTILFVPIFFFRKVTRFFSKKESNRFSDFSYFKNNGLINGMLGRLFGMEVFLLKWTRLPFGVSLVVLAKKIGLR